MSRKQAPADGTAPVRRQARTEDDFALMDAPDGATSVTHDGETYEVEDGLVSVPQYAVADLLSHGYKVSK